MINTAKKTTLTVNDAAAHFDRDPSRIRQICIANKIGKLIEGRIRLLKRRDIEKIGRIIASDGRKRNF